MASTVRQDPVSSASGGSGTTEAATINGIATASLIHVWGTNDATTTPTISCNDGVAYVNIPEVDVTDTTNVQRVFGFFKENSTSGNKTVTITWSSGVLARGICLIEIDGIIATGSQDKRTAQLQPTPTTGTDATTSGLTAALSKQPNIVLACSMCNGGSVQPAAGTGFSSPNSTYVIWNFGGGFTARVENKNTTSLAAVAGTFTAAGNTAHLTQVVVYDDIGSAGASVTTLDNEPYPRRPLGPANAGRQVEAFTTQPLGTSQPIKTFLDAEKQQPRVVPPIRRDHVPWVLQPTSAPAASAWFDDAAPDVNPPRPPIRPLEPGWSMQPLGTSSPVRTFLHQHPAVAPPRSIPAIQPPWNQQPLGSSSPVLNHLHQHPARAPGARPIPTLYQPWTGSPITQTLSPPLLNDEGQIIRPRRFRRWAAMGAMSRSGPAADTFLLAADASGRFLTNQGTPWLLAFRSVWGLVGLSVANYQSLIDDTAAKGYSAIEVSAIHHDSRSTWVPTAGNGQLPFSKTLAGATWTGGLWPSVTSTNQADFTTPVVAYWNYVRDIVDYAKTKGLAVVLSPSYHGIGGDDGWMNEMEANGLSNMSSHGAFVATLMKARSNIIWLLGGDAGTGARTYSAPQLAAEQGLVQGLQSVSGQKSTMFGAEWNTESIGADQVDHVTGTTGPTFGDTLTIQTYYSFTGDVVTQGRRAYGASPVKPAVMQECPFEDEQPTTGTGDNTASTPPVRRYHWWALLSGIAGFNAGEAYIWRTNLTGTPPASDDYRNHLNSTTAQEDALLITLYKTYHWWLLVPSGLAGMRTLVTAGTSNQTITAACASDGTSCLIYSGPDGNGLQFTVDLRSMNNNIRARWWDPTNGSFSTGGGAAGTFTLSNTASAQSFTPPGTNAGGTNNDWVLVLDT